MGEKVNNINVRFRGERQKEKTPAKWNDQISSECYRPYLSIHPCNLDFIYLYCLLFFYSILCKDSLGQSESFEAPISHFLLVFIGWQVFGRRGLGENVCVSGSLAEAITQAEIAYISIKRNVDLQHEPFSTYSSGKPLILLKFRP